MLAWLTKAQLFLRSSGSRMRWIYGVGALLFLLLLIYLIPSGSEAISEEKVSSSEMSLPGLVLDVLLKLGIILILIYLSFYALRNWKPGIRSRLKSQLQILESKRLSARQSLHILRVGDSTYLIGATDHTVSLLSEIELPSLETLDDGREAVSESFSSLLQQRFSRPSSLDQDASNSSTSQDSSRKGIRGASNREA
jgi:flagellar biogenesis protein FliO